jgi:Zn finger protein HypA/HybF involved in hydrogenase expression
MDDYGDVYYCLSCFAYFDNSVTTLKQLDAECPGCHGEMFYTEDGFYCQTCDAFAEDMRILKERV